MTKRARTERREREREALKVAKARLRLAALEPGGSPERPIEVTSASTIEVHAAGLPCPACGAHGVRVEEHEAITAGGRSLRVTHMLCPRCGVRRDLFFRIAPSLPS